MADSAYRVLRERLLSGAFGANERVLIGPVAEQLGFSRTPVREALNRLLAEGLVTFVAGRGFRIADPLEDLEHLYAIRASLEGLAASLAARVADTRALDEVEAAVCAAEEAFGAAVPDPAQVMRTNSDLHRKIAVATGSSRLVRLMNQVGSDYVSYKLAAGLDRDRLARSIDEHRMILYFLRRGEPEVAEALARAHVFASHLEVRRHRGHPQ